MQLRSYVLYAGSSLWISPSKCLGLEPKWHCHFGIPRQHRRLYHVSTLMVGRLGDLWEWTVLNHQQSLGSVAREDCLWKRQVPTRGCVHSKGPAWPGLLPSECPILPGRRVGTGVSGEQADLFWFPPRGATQNKLRKNQKEVTNTGTHVVWRRLFSENPRTNLLP